MYMWCQIRSIRNGSWPTTLPARTSTRSREPPSPMPVMPMSVSTVTSIALWLKLRFMLGCSQHLTRVTLAFGSDASARAGRISPAPRPPAPTASDLKSDLRFIIGGSPRSRIDFHDVIAVAFGAKVASHDRPLPESHVPRELVDLLRDQLGQFRVSAVGAKLLFAGAQRHQLLPLFVERCPSRHRRCYCKACSPLA